SVRVAATSRRAVVIRPAAGGRVVVDVSMGAITWGDVVAGLAQEDELVPFGGPQAHKAFALAVRLQLLLGLTVRDEGHGAVLLVARPEADPVPALRRLADGVRL